MFTRTFHCPAEEVESYIDSCYSKAVDSSLNAGSKTQHVVADMGLDGKPTILGKKEFERAVSESESGTIYRGVQSTEHMSAAAICDMTLHGERQYIGDGMHGDGTYFSTKQSTATNFAGNSFAIEQGMGKTMTACLSKKARIADESDLLQAKTDYHISDMATAALYMGYNTIKVSLSGETYFVTLDREALVFLDEHKDSSDIESSVNGKELAKAYNAFAAEHESGNNHDNFADSLDISGKSGSIKLENPHDDGGAGSGNWGHKGVPGQLGGSAKGGGVQNRTGSSEAGYSSEAKERAKASGASGGSGSPLTNGGTESGASGSAGSGSFGGASSAEFSKAVVSAKAELAKSRPQDAWRVTAHTKEELDSEYPGAKLHITKGGSTAAVTQSGDIISICKHPDDTARGKDLISESVANGGTKLDSYSGNHGFYVKCGFEPVSWCGWNDEYAPPDWDMSKGCAREPVIFYKYTGRKSKYATAEQFFEATPASVDYDAAQKVRDDSLKK